MSEASEKSDQAGQPDHQPRRGSDVEAYIKRWRNAFKKSSTTYRWLDHMLDDYRLRADYGRGLADSTEGIW